MAQQNRARRLKEEAEKSVVITAHACSSTHVFSVMLLNYSTRLQKRRRALSELLERNLLSSNILRLHIVQAYIEQHSNTLITWDIVYRIVQSMLWARYVLVKEQNKAGISTSATPADSLAISPAAQTTYLSIRNGDITAFCVDETTDRFRMQIWMNGARVLTTALGSFAAETLVDAIRALGAVNRIAQL